MLPKKNSIRQFNPKVKAICILIILGLLVYGNALNNGFVWDDDGQIVNNIMVHSLENLGMLYAGSTFGFSQSGQLTGIYYRPLMSTFFAIIYTFFGSSPFFFHLFQILVHIGNAIVIFLIFDYFFPVTLSLILSAIFLVHPINSETVEYVANTADVLFLFFGMTIILILKKKSSQIMHSISIGLLLLWSFFSKETAILFIPIIFLWTWLYNKKNVATMLLIFSCVISLYLLNRIGLAHIFLDKPDSIPISSLDLLHRLMNTPKIIFYYVSQFVLPIHLSIAQLWIIKSTNIPEFWLPLLIDISLFASLLSVGFYFWKYDHHYWKGYLFFSCWFFLGLLIHINITPLDMTVADRWFYFPIVGLLGIIGTVLSKTISLHPSWKVFIFISLSIVVFLFSFRTILRNQDWKDATTLFKHDLSISKNNYQLELLLAYELNKASHYKEAVPYANNSVRHFPTYSGWSTLGVSEIKSGNIDKGIQSLRNAYDMQPYEDVAQNFAYALVLYKQPQEAKEFIQQELTKFPNNPNFWFYMAISNYKLGHISEAMTEANQCYVLSNGERCKALYLSLQNNPKISPELLKKLLK